MQRVVFVFWMIFAFAALAVCAQEKQAPRKNRVDFCYALPWWQSAICLPDDSDKILVGKEGQVLLDFGGGGVRNFGISLQPDIVGGVKWLRQQTLSPRVPVMQTWKDAAGVEVLEEAFVVTPKIGETEAAFEGKRRLIVLLTLKNTTGKEIVCQPSLRINSAAPAKLSPGDNVVTIGPVTRVSTASNIKGLEVLSKTEYQWLLAPVTLAPGTLRQIAFTVDRRDNRPRPPATFGEAAVLRDAACRWWKGAGLPFETIQVPDADIQAMLEACVRNIWQAREIKKGKPAFHVGPTVYRGLWIVDGSFLLESATIMNRAKDARAGIEYMLSHQKPDGSFEVISHFWKENGIVLWAATRHAMLTQDKDWLRTQWPALQQVVKAIQNLRSRTLKDPKALQYGLLPAGEIDGGLSGSDAPEFSNTEWCLAGLKAAIGAAHWLGNSSDAAAWQKQYDDFYGAFRKAAARDMIQDKYGNAYLPTMMGNAGNRTPQKGQWSFCHAIYPGQVFPVGDSLAESQMAMLRATKVQGMVFDTGWMKDGIWTYFASFYGHAALWTGHGREAAEMLYDFANHAVPTRVWREEQRPVGKGSEEVGDMPHNWASAEFIRLTVHLLELDRGDELHLLEGMPAEWLQAGMVTKLNGILTPFGPLFMTVQVSGDGKTAVIEVKPLAANCKGIVVHLPDGSLRRLLPEQGGTLTFRIPSL